MWIELEEPYKALWDKGYLSVSEEGRKYLSLYKNGVRVSSTTYARYLMSVKLGHFVPDHLTVDHKDNDCTNDDPNNLQLLTQSENSLKESQRRYGSYEDKEMYGYQCVYCETNFIITLAERNKRIYTGVEHAFCSRNCAANYHRFVSGRNVIATTKPQDVIDKIKTLRSQGNSVYKIAAELNISRNTVMKYW